MQHKLKIHGMHCVSCEVRLEKTLNQINGIRVISVNHKNGDMLIEIKDDSLLTEVQSAIESLNYSLKAKETKINYRDLLLAMFIVGIGIYIFKDYGFVNNFETNNIGVIVALLLGIVASLSTCLALLGGIVISLSNFNNGEQTFMQRAGPHIFFNLGRIIGFTVLGAILGFVGKTVMISPSVNGIITILIAFIMLYMGLNILSLVPSITKLGFHLPKSIATSINSSASTKLPATLGALTFFLPCGFTQSVQLASVSSGSPIAGALIMGAFAIGTTPMLFALGVGAHAAMQHKFGLLKSVIGVIVVSFAVFSFLNGLKLNGISLIASSQSVVEQSISEPRPQSSVQFGSEIIKVMHSGRSLIPFSINLTAGQNYRLLIMPQNSGQGCMYAMFIPNVDEEPRNIIKGQQIEYDIKGLTKGTYPIICTSMGMEHGELIVN